MNVDDLNWGTISRRLLKQISRVNTGDLECSSHARSLDVEPPIRVSRQPRESDWVEFELTGAQIEPVDVIIDEVSREITQEDRLRNEL
jgi:hypothetical protein